MGTDISIDELYQHALAVLEPSKKLGTIRIGYVSAVLVDVDGKLYSGINIDADCGIGFCAEHAAMAAMLQQGVNRVHAMIAVTRDGRVISPCGRCRELLFQMNAENSSTKVVVSRLAAVELRNLLPMPWQPMMHPEEALLEKR